MQKTRVFWILVNTYAKNHNPNNIHDINDNCSSYNIKKCDLESCKKGKDERGKQNNDTY